MVHKSEKNKKIKELKTTLKAFIVQSPGTAGGSTGADPRNSVQGWALGAPHPGLLLSGTLCLFFREMFPFLGRETSRKIPRKDLPRF